MISETGLAILQGKPTGEGADMAASWALDIIHGLRSGQWPYPGGLVDQPGKLQAIARGFLRFTLARDALASSVASAMRGGPRGG